MTFIYLLFCGKHKEKYYLNFTLLNKRKGQTDEKIYA